MSKRIIKTHSKLFVVATYWPKVKHMLSMPVATDNILHFAIKAVVHFTFMGAAAVSHYIGFTFSPSLKNDVIRKKSVSIYI